MDTIEVQQDEPTEQDPVALTYVAVGASAGGLDALRALFAATTPDPQLAYVVLTHLPLHHVSHLAELLDRAGPVPTADAVSGEKLVGGHVYVMPPGRLMGLRNGKVFFDQAPQGVRPAPKPIDFFMASLAEDVGARCVGVVLSGTDHDGTVGLKAIRAAGGLTIVQAPGTAEFPGMPNSAINAGAADLVLHPAAVPLALSEFLAAQSAHQELTAVSLASSQELAHSVLDEILGVVLSRTGHDFRRYRPGMLKRRLHRRMALRHCAQAADYLALLHLSADEAALLSSEFLIGVTDFFRDPEQWRELEAVVLQPLIAQLDPAEAVFRVWSAGCSSGEESYSIAMAVLDVFDRYGIDGTAQVFGTDIDGEALATARLGVYADSIVSTVAADRLDKYFERRRGKFVVCKRLRNAVTFAPQNLVLDTPFSKLDFICCRNLLMYFEPGLQDRVIQLFHFALKPGGLLWLGKAESLGATHSALFEPVPGAMRLFRRIGGRSHLPKGLPLHGTNAPAPWRVGSLPLQARAADHLGEAERWLAPASDATLELLRISSEEASALYEEVQSSNEELESSKEELQALNEELSTVNAQLEDKIAETSQNADDLRNLLHSTHIATLLLDPQLRLRRFTPLAAELFRLRSGDEGRLLSDMAATVQDAALFEDAKSVLSTGLVEEAEVTGPAGATLLRRILPYVGHHGRTEGVVVTFVDVTPLKTAARQVAQLTAILDDSNDAVFTYDLQGCILSWNNGAERIYGYHRGEAVGMSVADLSVAAGSVSAAGTMQIGETILKGSVGPFDAERRTKDGQTVSVSTSATALRDRQGAVYAVLSTERDITERTRVASEIRFRRLADHVPALLRVEDAAGRTEFVNKECSVFTGQSSNVLVGKGWLEFVHPADRDRYLDEYAAAQAQQQRLDSDIRLLRHDGEYRWMRAISVPHVDPAGGFAGYVTQMVDVEDRKRAEMQLVDADHRKDEFLAMLAHELRNPLAPIRSAVAILGKTGLTDLRAQWAVGVIDRQAELMAKLLDGLLDVARISRGKMTLDLGPVELSVVIQRAVEISQASITARQQHLTVHFADDVMVEGDLLRLTQVFANLLNNASKYTDEEGLISVCVELEGEQASVRIEDNGAGIAADMLPRVFELFSQADTTLDRAKGGLGLGLTLVQQLVQLHGGTVQAESPGLGAGSTFTVRLPFLRWRGAPPVPQGALQARPSAAARCVMVVDDNVDGAQSLAAILEMEGHQVSIAYDGQQALQRAAERRPDVVLLDIGLPGMDGYQVARALRGAAATSNVTLIALTGYGQPEDVERAKSAGFDQHLVKPIDLEVVAALVAAAPCLAAD